MAYLSIEATSIMRGMSNEKPALDLLLWIAIVWSAYEVIGEIIMNMGATKPVMKEVIPMMH